MSVCTKAQVPKQAHSCRFNFFVEACFKFELAPQDYTTLCMRICTRGRNAKNILNVIVFFIVFFYVNIMGGILLHQKIIKVMYTYCALSRYIDYCDRPRYAEFFFS